MVMFSHEQDAANSAGAGRRIRRHRLFFVAQQVKRKEAGGFAPGPQTCSLDPPKRGYNTEDPTEGRGVFAAPGRV